MRLPMISSTVAPRSKVEQQSSEYLRYLPAIYQQDPFLGQFLRIFEDLLFPIQVLVNGLSHQFDPQIASPMMARTLALWVGQRDIAGIPDDRWRVLISRAVWLHRWRGTKHALREAVRIVVGTTPLISEYATGAVLGPDARLGINTELDTRQALRFTMTFECPEELVDRRLLEAIINFYKPANVQCIVRFVQSATVPVEGPEA
jgi:phage tail-like protein